MERSSLSMRALLIEHDQDTRDRVARQLASQDIYVTTCDEGRQALAVALTRPHDVILADSRLPGLDGYQLCQLLRQDAATCRTPILVMTDEESDGEIERATRTGATAVLAKSCSADALLEAMRRASDTTQGAVALPLASGASTTRPRNGRRPAFMSRLFARRATTTPPKRPPQLLCPECERPLAYLRSHLGGVSHRHPEQWDDFDCVHGCGGFEFRHRTRRLRPVE